MHSNTNNSVCNDGEMILMDFGVCYANYNSDTTRCFPVNGKFTDRQKEVYNAVLYCLKEGTKLLKPGAVSATYEKEMADIRGERLHWTPNCTASPPTGFKTRPCRAK